ncbi:Fc.00g080960.m01.CDS01 [Cosmosporella sp. VM-42]
MIAAAREKATSGPPPESSSGRHSNSKKRVRNFTADDRAAHRLFEKGRREAFKERLNELATHLPNLSDTEPQRLSKHVVINESIARHKLLHSTCVDALDSIRALMQERDELLAEVNTWRNSAGVGVRQSVGVNVNNLVTLEAEAQQRPSRLPPGHGGQYNSDSSTNRAEDQTQPPPGNTTNNVSHLPTIPTESATETLPVSTNPLEGLVLDTSWSPTNQDALPFQNVSRSNDPLMSIDGVNNRDQRATGPLLNAPNEIDAYQIFGEVGLDQPISPSVLNPPSTQDPLSGTHDSTVYDPLDMQMSMEQLGAIGLSPGTLLSQSDSWVVWPS